VDKYNISFHGEILPGQDLAEVKLRFAKAFQLEELGRTDAFFSGQKIILRRNLAKEDAARVYAALRKLGLDIKIVKLTPPAEEATEAATPEAPPPEDETTTRPGETPSPRRRQPGAPNIFGLQLSERAGHDVYPEKVSQTLLKAPLIAAALVMLAFILVGLRFWGQAQPAPIEGLGYASVDPAQQVLVQAGEQLIFHDRAGNLLQQRSLSEFNMVAHTPFGFIANGDLLLFRHKEVAEESRWQIPGLAQEVETRMSFARCSSVPTNCTELLPDVGPATFTVDTRNDVIFLADAGNNTLTKLNGAGMILAARKLELSAPMHLRLQEGILYLTQAGSDSVIVLKPDDQGFGRELDRIPLAVEQASQSGHIYAGDLAWMNEHWWVIMQSRDGATSALYQFDARWKYVAPLPLPAGAHPLHLTPWDTRILVTDQQKKTIYRLDATARAERDFASESIAASLTAQHSEFSLSRGLQGMILLILFVGSAALLAFGVWQSLRGKVYIPPADQDEKGFDINSSDIYWLDPDPKAPGRMRTLGYGMVAFALLVLITAFVAQLSVWILLAITAIFAGLGGLYFAMVRAASCHLGTLDGQLILVDHTNTYRVGQDSKIQYYNNYVMIDDVIIYLGNRVVHQFATTPLQQTFTPLVNRGIKVDRTTLRVKLIQSRHPMWLGSGGLAGALLLAALLLLLS
jgi:hypothetical protein